MRLSSRYRTRPYACPLAFRETSTRSGYPCSSPRACCAGWRSIGGSVATVPGRTSCRAESGSSRSSCGTPCRISLCETSLRGLRSWGFADRPYWTTDATDLAVKEGERADPSFVPTSIFATYLMNTIIFLTRPVRTTLTSHAVRPPRRHHASLSG